jgi:hypothetical protein
MSEQLRVVSPLRFRRRVGALEQKHLKRLEDLICWLLELFQDS